MSNWICCLWKQNSTHGFNFLYTLNAQHDADGSSKAMSRFECAGCAIFPGWWQLSQEPFDTFIGIGLRKSLVLLSFMKFPWQIPHIPVGQYSWEKEYPFVCVDKLSLWLAFGLQLSGAADLPTKGAWLHHQPRNSLT